MPKTIKEECEALGKKTGKRIGEHLSQEPEGRAQEIGEKIGSVVGEQMDRAQRAISKEQVTKKDQLGIGGKIGTGIGIIGKRLVEKSGGLFGPFAGAVDLVSEGREVGAKAEKIVKRAVKAQIEKVAAKQKKDDNH